MYTPLEDNVSDILLKAQRGLGIRIEGLREPFDAATLRRVAPILHLNAEALLGLAEYTPAPVRVPHLRGFITDYGDMRVNAWLAWDPATREAVAFDTGADGTPILETLHEEGLRLTLLLLTHAHRDHSGDAETLLTRTGAQAFIGAGEASTGNPRIQPFTPGERTFHCGALRIRPLATRGHTVGGVSYLIEGLECPAAIVGDALFAGSMGGGLHSYEEALRTNREALLTLPPETVLCPGHGPATTVDEERVHNPFFAE